MSYDFFGYLEGVWMGIYVKRNIIMSCISCHVYRAHFPV